MSSLKKVISIGKDKKQPPEHDAVPTRPFISSPHMLAPKSVIDEWARKTKVAQLEAEKRERDVVASQSSTQPPTAHAHNNTKGAEKAVKSNFRIIFTDKTKPLPPIPRAGNLASSSLNGLVHREENSITVSLARRSAASSWFCAGPNSPTDKAIMQPPLPGSQVITEATPAGPVFVFRNEQERQQAIRVLATLRESKYVESDNPNIAQCGRECTQCLEKMAHRRDVVTTSEETFVDYPTVENSLVEPPAQQVVIYVTEDSEDVGSEQAPRLSLLDTDNCVIHELEVQSNAWRTSLDI